MKVEIISRYKPSTSTPELKASMRNQENLLMEQLDTLDPTLASDREAITTCVALLELRCCVKVSLPDALDLSREADTRVERARQPDPDDAAW